MDNASALCVVACYLDGRTLFACCGNLYVSAFYYRIWDYCRVGYSLFIFNLNGFASGLYIKFTGLNCECAFTAIDAVVGRVYADCGRSCRCTAYYEFLLCTESILGCIDDVYIAATYSYIVVAAYSMSSKTCYIECAFTVEYHLTLAEERTFLVLFGTVCRNRRGIVYGTVAKGVCSTI